MKLLEYEAKAILSKFDIPTPRSEVVKKVADLSIDLPVVLKSQVPIGGRGKAGGIVVVNNPHDIQLTIDNLLSLDIKGYKPRAILAEEKLAIKKELYLSVLIDRSSSSIQIVANTNGGVEVEGNLEGSFWKVAIGKSKMEGGELEDRIWNSPYGEGRGTNKEYFDKVGQQLADYYDLPDQTFVLQDLVQNLYKCFVKNDATLIEINPLILTTDGKLIAGDCKMTLDDNAAFRHDWKFEEAPAETNFVTINKKGQVATIANGAGLAMATVDAVAGTGMSPANFLDIGGGANTQSVINAFNKIMEFSHVKVIVINIFAGITRLDEIANAIVAAKSQIPDLPDLCIRLAGTNYDKAKEILDTHNIALLPDLQSCLNRAKEIVS